MRLSLLPAAGRGGIESYILPVVTLAVAPAAVLARFTRSAMLETLGSDYVMTARAKGALRGGRWWAAMPSATRWCPWSPRSAPAWAP